MSVDSPIEKSAPEMSAKFKTSNVKESNEPRLVLLPENKPDGISFPLDEAGSSVVRWDMTASRAVFQWSFRVAMTNRVGGIELGAPG